MNKLDLAFTFDDVLLIPRHGKQFSPSACKTQTNITKGIKIDVPILATGMPTVTESQMAISVAENGAVGIIHPFLTLEKYISEIRKVKEKKLIVGAAVGEGDYDRAVAAVKAGANFIAIDTYHGNTTASINFLKRIRKDFPKIEILYGFFVTSEGIAEAVKAGASGIRVGIGPGSHCTTRIVGGVGFPQLSSIVNCFKATKRLGVPLIATGGIKNSGDIVKAIAAGASAVEIGGLFTGTDESPGEIINKGKDKYKETWGYCSVRAERGEVDLHIFTSLKNLIKRIIYMEPIANPVPINKISEGIEEVLIPYKGSVHNILNTLENGLKTGMAYCGANDLDSLRKKAKFIQITNSGLLENYPHGLSDN